MIEIGKVNDLIVSRETKSGYYLMHPEHGNEVFMPPSMGPIKVNIDQKMKVFVYLDTKGSLIASAEIPTAVVGEYGLMRAIDVQEFGAFFDWGIDKDLLVPGNEQKVKVRNFEYHIVRVCLEEGADRIYGTTKLGKYIESSEFDLAPADKVKMVVAEKTELGHRVIINRKYIGMIYHNETFSSIRVGDTYDGVVKVLREDGLVDAALQTQGILNLVEAKDKILEMLEKRGGKSDLHDKSSPEMIKRELSMSKKTFKSAIGMLYKEKKIEISKTGISLV